MPYLSEKEMKVVKAYCDEVREALGEMGLRRIIRR